MILTELFISHFSFVILQGFIVYGFAIVLSSDELTPLASECLSLSLINVFLLFWFQDFLFLSFDTWTRMFLGLDLCVYLTWSLLRFLD